MAAPGADDFALIGTGKQAMTQLAAVAAVRPLKQVRVFGRDSERRAQFVARVKAQGFDFAVEEADSVAAAAKGAAIVTLVTRAREAVFQSADAAGGSHINAVGAITPEREEFAQDVFARAGLVAADDPATARILSKEFRDFYGESDDAWQQVASIATVVAQGRGRAAGCDLSLFKAMGMGISDMALGMEIYARAVSAGLGRSFAAPVKRPPRLRGH
jgi:ornithine cyclodeaminase